MRKTLCRCQHHLEPVPNRLWLLVEINFKGWANSFVQPYYFWGMNLQNGVVVSKAVTVGSFWLSAIAFCAQSCFAQSQPISQLPNQTIVGTKPTHAQERREFAAGKIIIGRNRIENSGASNVEELLRREPAVSISSDGRIGLLGLPGYTQILVDGEPPAAGKSLEMNVERVEKIEFIKSNVAEYGPFGIAGTINVITRKTERKVVSSLRLEGRSEGGQFAENLAYSQNQTSEGSPWRIGLQMSASEVWRPKEEHLEKTVIGDGQAAREQWQGIVSARERNLGADVSLSLDWTPSESESFNFSPSIARLKEASHGIDRRIGAEALAFVDASTRQAGGLTFVSLPMNWVLAPDEQNQWELKWNTNLVQFDRASVWADSASMSDKFTLNNGESSAQVSHSLGIIYKTQFAEKHELKLGVSTVSASSNVDLDNRTNGIPNITSTLFGSLRHTAEKTWKAFAQNEQRLSESLSLNAGISVESKKYELIENELRSQPSYVAWSPSLHLSKKMGDDDTRQLRFSIAQSFKAPELDSFTLRPQFNPLAPCGSRNACSANNIDTFDSAGNSALRPERALGLNLSYEHGFGDDSQVSIELFSRTIEDKMGAAIALESVPWSSNQRYVARPVNLGTARAQGLNIEAELAMHDLIAEDAPKLFVRGSLSLAQSQVSSIAGPDNKLDSQVPWSAKLGASYTLKNAPWKFDLDGNWAPPFTVRVGGNHLKSMPRRNELSAAAHWTLAPGQRLTIKVRNFLSGTAIQLDEYTSPAETIRLATATEKFSVISVQFSTRL